MEKRIKRFWEWMEREAATLRGYPVAEQAQMIIPRIQQIDRGLVVDIRLGLDGVIELRVSADGVVGVFGTVMRVVDAASILEGYSIQAFRPAVAGHFNLVYEGVLYETSNAFVMMRPEQQKVMVSVLLIGVALETDLQAAEAMVANALGEYVYGTRVSRVVVGILDQEREYPGLQPFVYLPTLMKEWVGES